MRYAMGRRVWGASNGIRTLSGFLYLHGYAVLMLIALIQLLTLQDKFRKLVSATWLETSQLEHGPLGLRTFQSTQHMLGTI